MRSECAAAFRSLCMDDFFLITSPTFLVILILTLSVRVVKRDGKTNSKMRKRYYSGDFSTYIGYPIIDWLVVRSWRTYACLRNFVERMHSTMSSWQRCETSLTGNKTLKRKRRFEVETYWTINRCSEYIKRVSLLLQQEMVNLRNKRLWVLEPDSHRKQNFLPCQTAPFQLGQD